LPAGNIVGTLYHKL